MPDKTLHLTFPDALERMLNESGHLLVLESLGDVLVFDQTHARRYLLVTDSLARGLVDLVQLDTSLGVGCRVEPDRNRDQGQPEP